MSSRTSFARAGIVALGLATAGSLVSAAPCDIYGAAGNICVAAHSTTRALFSAFNGPLYQVRRSSDSTTKTISTISAGGVANAATQDAFCAGTTCVISIIYDQTTRANHLTQAPGGRWPGPAAGGFDNLAVANAAPVYLNGNKVYGVFIAPGDGYRNTVASGTAIGDAAQGIYAVLDGTHYNGQCCFDYGNAEVSSFDTGAGHMEAINFGNSKQWGYGSGSGPWIMADLENGLFSGSSATLNSGDMSINHRFITAIVKGKPGTWEIRGGNAQSGSLTIMYNGVRPSGYNPMHKEGSIILGIGGDNSHGAQGTFYEGVMTTGYPTDATEDLVQEEVIAAGYATTAVSKPPTSTTAHVSTPVSTSTTHTTTQAPTTASPVPTTTATKPPTSGGSSPHWGQCAGIGWTGFTVCAAPFTCTYSNPYYSQCL